MKTMLYLYITGLILMSTVPLGWLNKVLIENYVFQIRLDYLLHGLVFVPVVVLWRLGFPRHPLWVIMLLCAGLAAGLEGVQFLLPYRVWSINDAAGNMAGVVLGGVISALVSLKRGRD
jgi:glycopeptide antibiotics resistance protein